MEKVLEHDRTLVTATDDDLYTPLHRAAYNGHLTVMQCLLRHGADANAPTLDGWTPLHSGENQSGFLLWHPVEKFTEEYFFIARNFALFPFHIRCRLIVS